MPATDKPLLLVLGAGERDHNAYNLQQLAKVHPLLLLDAAPAYWAEPYIVGSWAIDLAQEDVVAAAVTALPRERIAGVVTYMEQHTPLAARIAEALGLPGATVAAMNACRDKLLTRGVLAKARVPSAQSHPANDEQQAVDHAQRLGYPVVVKPRAMAASAGVVRADSEADVRHAFETASSATALGLGDYALPGTLVEEYLPGPEISAECVVLAPGDVRIVAITRKQLGDEPRFLAVGHTVSADDELIYDRAVLDVARRAVEVVGIGLGVVQVEMRLTSRGPRVVEVNGRLAGDHIPLLVHLATGINLPRVAADLALGRTPELTPSWSHCAGVRFLYAPTSGRLGRYQLKAPPAQWLERFVWTGRAGAVVEAPAVSIDDRIAHWVVTAPDPTTCENRLLLMQGLITTHIAPAPSSLTAVAR